MKKILLWLIEWYRKCVSPFKGFSCCKYVPTCSAYGKEAVSRFGCLKGGAMAIWRIIRCNPFSKGGYDPVPVRKGFGNISLDFVEAEESTDQKN